MGKVYVQHSASVLDYSGTVAGSDAGVGGNISGSLKCLGFSRLVGGLYLSASLESASGFQVSQSVDNGTSWDFLTACNTFAAGASTFSYEIFGDAVKVYISNGSSENTIRTLWHVMPIQTPDLNNRLSASISSGSIIVTSGSVVVTNQVSASVSNRVSASLSSGSVTTLSPAGSDMHIVLETSTSTIGAVASIGARVSASLASGSVTTLSPAGSDMHVVLETSASTIGVISGINTRVSASLASGSVTVLSSAGSDLHVVLETSTSSIGSISSASMTSGPWKVVWSGSGTIAGSDAGVGDLASGSLDVTGFGRLVGTLYLSASLAAASGLRVSQSGNNGTNWDVLTACLPAAAGGSGFSYEIYGTAVKIDLRAGSSAVDYRANWFARQGA